MRGDSVYCNEGVVVEKLSMLHAYSVKFDEQVCDFVSSQEKSCQILYQLQIKSIKRNVSNVRLRF